MNRRNAKVEGSQARCVMRRVFFAQVSICMIFLSIRVLHLANRSEGAKGVDFSSLPMRTLRMERSCAIKEIKNSSIGQ